MSHSRRGALHYACERGHVNIVQSLLQKEAIDVDDHNAFYQTPLYIALQHGHTGQWLFIKVPRGMKRRKLRSNPFNIDICLHVSGVLLD